MCAPISRNNSGADNAAPTHIRRVMSISSRFGPSSALGDIGSSAMPQIGHDPGPSRTISGCIGQVHFELDATTGGGAPALCMWWAWEWASPLASCRLPPRYFTGSFSNLVLQPALQNNTSAPSCMRRCGVSALGVIPQTGSRFSATPGD